MRVINESRFQDFNGKIYRTQKECINAEEVFAHKVYKILDELVKGCKDNGNKCSCCPFYDNIDGMCYFEMRIGSIPESW